MCRWIYCIWLFIFSRFNYIYCPHTHTHTRTRSRWRLVTSYTAHTDMAWFVDLIHQIYIERYYMHANYRKRARERERGREEERKGGYESSGRYFHFRFWLNVNSCQGFEKRYNAPHSSITIISWWETKPHINHFRLFCRRCRRVCSRTLLVRSLGVVVTRLIRWKCFIRYVALLLRSPHHWNNRSSRKNRCEMLQTANVSQKKNTRVSNRLT